MKVKIHGRRSQTKAREGLYGVAVLTENGLMIDQDVRRSHMRRNKSSSTITSLTSYGSGSQSHPSNDEASAFETASLISCVTCLSDTPSVRHENSGSKTNLGGRSSSLSLAYSKSESPERRSSAAFRDSRDFRRSHFPSMNGQIPVHAVIPYNRIINARYLHSRENENPARAGSGEINSSMSKESSSVDNGDDPSSLDLVEITFANPRRHDIVPKRLTLHIKRQSGMTYEWENDADPALNSNDIVEEIMKRSYVNAKRFRSILVIINPFGGKGKAKKLFMTKVKPLLYATNFRVEVTFTDHPQHAVEIAKELDIDKYDTIACASGDGVPFEVINGLFQRSDRIEAFNKLAITQIPCGSGNAMSISCHWTNNASYATLCLIKSVESRIDLMHCSQPGEPPKLSFLSQTYGIIAESDINTEFMKWMGPARFELGVAYNIIQRKKYPCDIYVKYFAKSKNTLKVHYLEQKAKKASNNQDIFDLSRNSSSSTSLLNSSMADTVVDDDKLQEDDFKIKYPLEDGIPDDWERLDPVITQNLGLFYTGKMPYVAADTKFFPAALPSDGAMDMVATDGRTSLTRMASILLALDKGSHVLQPEVQHSKILAYKLIPKQKVGFYSVDGEKFPLKPLQVEILPRLCKTLLRNGSFVDTDFDSM